jgi:integrase
MGRRSETGGVRVKGDRIEFNFSYQGKRYRPTLKIKPTELNLRNARLRIKRINNDIRNGTFVFADEFPEYRFLSKTPNHAENKTFKDVADLFLASIKSELAYSTHESYRKILDSFWKPKIGSKIINDIKYSDLTSELNKHPVGKKTRNNIVSVVRGVFNFAMHDHLITESPADNLKTLKVQKSPPDPYSVEDAEYLLEGLREDAGNWIGNYFEFCFFSGLRPSETIALQWKDADRQKGVILVSKARVMAQDKDTTKTSVEREVELNPRAKAVLERQWALTGLCGKHIFGHENGNPYHDLQVQWRKWEYTHKRIGIRYREPYQTRHTSVTWNLMIGKNLLWVAEMHGHSPAVMLKTYAKWLKGATDEDIQAIKIAMGFGTNLALEIPKIRMSPVKMAEREGFEPS